MFKKIFEEIAMRISQKPSTSRTNFEAVKNL